MAYATAPAPNGSDSIPSTVHAASSANDALARGTLTKGVPTKGTLAKGMLDSIVPSTATKQAYLVFTIPGTSYKIYCLFDGDLSTSVGKRIKGTISVDARRVDHVNAGGKFVEPVFGKPRRIQGLVTAVDATAGTLVVDAGGGAVPGFDHGLPIIAKVTDPRQKATDYAVGSMVMFDCPQWPTFKQA